MNRPLRLCFLALAWACGASAAVYALLRYGLQPADEFSAYNHPAQPFALATHVISSFALSFVLGVVFHAHVLPRLSGDGRGRRSGLLLCSLAAAMIASGALLPCASQPGLRQFLFLAHAISGSAFALALPWHILLVRRATARARADAQPHVSVGPLQRSRRLVHPRLRV